MKSLQFLFTLFFLLSCLFEDDLPYSGTTDEVETGVMTGRVVDRDGKPVSGVVARLTGLDTTSVTDEEGYFRFTIKGESDRLVKNSALSFQDTLTLSYKDQIFYKEPISAFIATLPTVVLGSIRVTGLISRCKTSITSVTATFRELTDSSSLEMTAKLEYHPQADIFSGTLYYAYTSAEMKYAVHIHAFGSDDKLLVRSEVLYFSSGNSRISVSELKVPINQPDDSQDTNRHDKRNLYGAWELHQIYEDSILSAEGSSIKDFHHLIIDSNGNYTKILLNDSTVFNGKWKISSNSKFEIIDHKGTSRIYDIIVLNRNIFRIGSFNNKENTYDEMVYKKYVKTPLPGKVIAHWDFNNVNSASLKDKSGTGNHAVIEGAPTWVTGIEGKAIKFDGSEDVYLPITDKFRLNSFTFSFWIHPEPRTKVPGNFGAMVLPVFTAFSDTLEGLHIELNHVGYWEKEVKNNVYVNNTISFDNHRILYSEEGTVGPDTWQHVAVTYDQTTGRHAIYINGLLKKEQAFSKEDPLLMKNLYVGKIPAYFKRYWGGKSYKGLLDEVMICNYPLDASAVIALYRKHKPPSSAGLLHPSLFEWSGNASDTSVRTLPKTLAETGFDKNNTALFKPYTVNVPQWRGFMQANRYIYLPPGSKVIAGDSVNYKFPEGTVFIRDFYIDLVQGDPASRKFVEAQFQIMKADGQWARMTYVYNDDGTAHSVVDTSFYEKNFVVNLNGQNPNYTSPTVEVNYMRSAYDCEICHFPATANGFITQQLNDGAQLNNLVTTGVLAAAPNTIAWKAAGKIDRWYDWNSTGATLIQKIHSYMAANCSHCHTNRREVLEAGMTHTYDYFSSPPQNIYDGDANTVLLKPDPSKSDSSGSYAIVRMAKREMPPMENMIPDRTAINKLVEFTRELLPDLAAPSP